MMNIVYFYDNFFSFYKKVPSPLDLAGVFRSVFTPNPGDVFD